ncbi:major facilitator superfamily domain-containing protein [Coniochaeta sp. 2T2.1]|nr:major facilitator superfamily domain-containing protein [Coniochaeta sp. 2T2.1]
MSSHTEPLHDLHEDEKVDRDAESADPTPIPEDKDDSDSFPEGGLRAWLVAAGAGGILFSTLGYSNSFGVFQAYYTTHQLRDVGPDDIAWIGGTQGFLTLAAGAIGGPLFDRYGAWVIRPAAVLYVFGIMMTSICTKFWHFMLAQGILTGLSTGLVMFPAMSAVSQYFRKRRGASIGCALAGSSLGAVVFPVILSQLLSSSDIGFGWSVRICAFIMLPVLAFSCVAIKARLPPRSSHFFLIRAFRDPLYDILIVSSFFLFVGMFIPLFYLPTYGTYRGMQEKLAFYLVAIVNSASLPGRIIPGILGDKVGRMNALSAAGFATAILIFCWPKTISVASIIVFAVLVGFTSGAIISGISVVLSTCTKDPKNVGTYMGQGIAIASLAALVAPSANGALLKAYGGFEQVSYLSGSCCLFGAVLLFGAKRLTPQGLLGKV